MIRHIVGWKLTAEDEAGKAVAAEAIRAALEGLVPLIDGLIDLKVVSNSADIAGNSDLALIAHYANVDDLRAYIAHPAHREAVGVVRANTTERWAIDYDIE
jgi:hypothetical protein